MTLKEFLVQFQQKVEREQSVWSTESDFGCLRRESEGLLRMDCPLTYLAKEFAPIGTCGERLGLRPQTARRIAAAADDAESTDGLRTRLLRAANVKVLR